MTVPALHASASVTVAAPEATAGYGNSSCPHAAAVPLTNVLSGLHRRHASAVASTAAVAKPLSSPKVELAAKVEVVALRAEVQELRQTVVEQAARLQRLEQLFSTFSERGHCSEQFPSITGQCEGMRA